MIHRISSTLFRLRVAMTICPRTGAAPPLFCVPMAADGAVLGGAGPAGNLLRAAAALVSCDAMNGTPGNKPQGPDLREKGRDAAGQVVGLGHDIRLDCRGLDRDDNDFVIGLLGPELFPLSAMIQAMRRTRQTEEFIARLGPFFVGRAVWQREKAAP
jgi:hypothetical protein